MTIRSCTPNSVGRSLARQAACTSASALRRRQPCSRKAASVAPRASALTCARPVAARRAPRKPPIAPAPTIQTFISIPFTESHGDRRTTKRFDTDKEPLGLSHHACRECVPRPAVESLGQASLDRRQCRALRVSKRSWAFLERIAMAKPVCWRMLWFRPSAKQGHIDRRSYSGFITQVSPDSTVARTHPPGVAMQSPLPIVRWPGWPACCSALARPSHGATRTSQSNRWSRIRPAARRTRSRASMLFGSVARRSRPAAGWPGSSRLVSRTR